MQGSRTETTVTINASHDSSASWKRTKRVSVIMGISGCLLSAIVGFYSPSLIWLSLALSLFGFFPWLLLAKQGNDLLRELKLRDDQIESNKKRLDEYMRDVEHSQMEESRRKWVAEGITIVSDVLRLHAGTNELYDRLVYAIVKHLNANQAGIFVLEEDEAAEMKLRLKACYAYEKRKIIEKSVDPECGLIGQCYLERSTIYVTHLKNDHLKITSGLGGAMPKALLLTPLKTDDDVQGVVEIASFTPFEKHHIEFVERVSVSIASTIHNLNVNERTKKLLEQSQRYAEQISANEEEMRQNLEELMATQEEMKRKESHLQAQSDLMEFIIDNIPFPVFIKDENGCYLMVNKAEAEIFNCPKSRIIGYDDSKFVHDKEEMNRIRESDKRIVTRHETVHFPEQVLTLSSGVVKTLKTSKLPFYNKVTGKINILGVSVDLSEVKNVERTLNREIAALKRELERVAIKSDSF